MNDFFAPNPNVSAELSIAKELGIPAWKVATVGSTLICGDGNDHDILCLVDQKALERAGFYPDVEEHYESDLHSYRRDGVNIIATQSEAFFFAEIAIAYGAREIAKTDFNMGQRDERIRFHSTVRCEVMRRLAARTEGGAQ